MATVAKTLTLSGSNPTKLNFHAESDAITLDPAVAAGTPIQPGASMILNVSAAIWLGGSAMTGVISDSAQFPAGIYTMDLRGDDDLYAIAVSGTVTLGVVLLSV